MLVAKPVADPILRSGATPSGFARWIALAVLVVGLVFAAPGVTAADPGDVGYEGPSFQGASGSPSGSKPESKLWYNDGYWWGSLFDSGSNAFYIWRLDPSTQTWTRTSALIDTRTNSRTDILWDGTKLYIATYRFSESDGTGDSRLLRFSYNASTDVYTLDSGFPATINTVRSESLTLAKDSTGQLWATWEQGSRIWVNHSTTADNAWGTPFAVPGAADVNSDDISSIIAFGGDKIGVFWSNQSANPDADYFAIHRDSDADTSWQPIETAYSGSDVADDHVNLATDASGRVYSVVKTSMGSSDPLVVLLVRQTNGSWSNHTVSTGASPAPTRPIVLIDESNSLLRVFYASGSSGGTINEKTSPMSSISFPTGAGTVVMRDFDSADLNNPTSTKQNVTTQTGLVVLATNDTTRRYWHANILGSGGPPPGDTTPPTLTGATVDGATMTLTYDEALDTGSVPAASTLTPRVNGATRTVSGVAIAGSAVTVTLGSPVVSTDTVTISYAVPASNPIQDLAGNDAAALSDRAVTNTTAPPAGPVATFAPTDDAQVKSNSATRNYGSDTSMRLREDPGTKTTYRSYVKFSVTGVSGTVESVKLRLFVTTKSGNTAFVHAVASTWSESTLTWNTAPPIEGTAIGSAVPGTAGAWVEFDLAPSAVAGNGTYSFGLKSNGTTSAIFNTKEASTNRPQLVVSTTSGGPPPGDTTPPTLTGATVDGATMTLTYDEALDTGSVPAASTLTPRVNGATRTVSGVAIAGSAVTVTLGSPVVSTDTVTISYAVPASNPIQDLAGNDAAALSDRAVTNTTAPPPPPGDTTQTFTPTDDSQVKSNSLNTNYGGETTIRLREDPGTGTTYRSYVKFSVTGVSGTVTSAKLRLFVTTRSGNTAFVHAVASTWSESTLTWNTAPPIEGTAIGSAVPGTAGAWVEFDLAPSAVAGNGTYSFGLKSNGTTSAIFSTKEGADAPQLVITSGS